MSNSSSPVCPRCGASLVAGSVEGLCANCLGALNFVTETNLPEAGRVVPAAPVSVDELAPHFPQLEILECLGRGGMGVVYKARQKSLNRAVALKLLAPERAGDAAFAVRFAREAQALAALNHPSIVGVYDFGQAGGFFYLLMEFVDGVNLRQAMQAGRFTPEQALAVVPPVCEALQFAHDHGIVHRDIKPENLLLDKAGRVKIADFGIAKMLGDDSTAGLAESQPAGTPQYMAPEQKEHRRTDHRADIYSLGVVLYEMLTGELPAAHLQPPSRKVQVDVRLDEIVLRALEKAPERRYQTAAEMGTHAGTVAAAPDRAISGSEDRGLFLSRFALILLVGGLILPPIVFALGGRSWVATAAGAFVSIICMLMAFGFALFSRGQKASRAILIAVPALFVVLGVFCALFVEVRKSHIEAEVQRVEAAMRAEEASAMQMQAVKQKEDAALRAQANPGALSFGPIHELAIKDAFDLDTGRADEMPNEPAKTHDPAEPVVNALSWLEREGMDVSAHGSNAFLQTFGMKVVAQANDTWDNLSAAGVVAQLAAPNVRSQIMGKVATENKKTTCLFQTREGGQGILQFLGAQDDDSVKFRYKLVSKPSAVRSANFSSQPAPLISEDSLKAAREALQKTKARMEAGEFTQLQVLEAEEYWQWAEAMYAGNPSAAVLAKRDGARRRLAMLKQQFDAGIVDAAEIAGVERELAEAEAATGLDRQAPALVLATKAWQGDIPNFIEALGNVPVPNGQAEEPGSSKTISFDVPEKHTPAIVKSLQAKPPLSVEVCSQDGTPIASGELVSVADHINETSGTLRCVARVTPKPDTLLYPGQFALVRLLLETRRGVTLIPASALQRKPKGALVYVLDPSGLVTSREVTPGAINQGATEITKGLEPGEIIAKDAKGGLTEGATVVYKLTPEAGE